MSEVHVEWQHDKTRRFECQKLYEPSKIICFIWVWNVTYSYVNHFFMLEECLYERGFNHGGNYAYNCRSLIPMMCDQPLKKMERSSGKKNES